MKNNRILIHVKNGIVDTVLIEDENQTIFLGAEEAPEIILMDENEQGGDPVNFPPVHPQLVTSEAMDKYKSDIVDSYDEESITYRIDKLYKETKSEWRLGGFTDQTAIAQAAADIRKEFSDHPDAVEKYISGLEYDLHYIKQ